MTTQLQLINIIIIIIIIIMMPQTCWVNLLWINIYICVICWIFLLLIVCPFFWDIGSHDWCPIFRTAWWIHSQGSNVQSPREIFHKNGGTHQDRCGSQKLAQIQWSFLLSLPRTTQNDASPRRRLRKASSVGIMFSSASSWKTLACYEVFQNSCELMNQRLVIRKGN